MSQKSDSHMLHITLFNGLLGGVRRHRWGSFGTGLGVEGSMGDEKKKILVKSSELRSRTVHKRTFHNLLSQRNDFPLAPVKICR